MRAIRLISLLAGCGTSLLASTVNATVTVATHSLSITCYPGEGCGALPACPSGSIAVGGGWAANEDVLKIDHSYLAGNQRWTTQAYNYGTWTEQLTTYVRCASGLPTGASASQVMRISPIPANTPMNLTTLPCPSGAIQTAVGFVSPDWVEATTVGWTSAVFKNPMSYAANVQLNAVCLSGVGPNARVDEYTSTTFVDMGNGYGMSGVSCPPGTVATGGAFSGVWSGDLYRVPYYSNSDSTYSNGWTIQFDWWWYTDISAKARVFCATIP